METVDSGGGAARGPRGSEEGSEEAGAGNRPGEKKGGSANGTAPKASLEALVHRRPQDAGAAGAAFAAAAALLASAICWYTVQRALTFFCATSARALARSGAALCRNL